jgi:hypothetical protein
MIAVPGVLIAAIDDYLKRNDNIYDLPSVPLLEADRDEFKSLRHWAERALPVLAENVGLKPDTAYVRQIRGARSELPAALQEHSARSATPLRKGRRIGRLPLATGRLPRGFRLLEFGPEPLPVENDYSQRERYHAINFLQEVQAADSCASLLFDSPDMPWEFYFDLSRHMWDESRHAVFGETKLLALGPAHRGGLSDKAYAMRQTLAPHDRYAALTTQEADAFPGNTAGSRTPSSITTPSARWRGATTSPTKRSTCASATSGFPSCWKKSANHATFEQVKADACNWRVSVLAESTSPPTPR